MLVSWNVTRACNLSCKHCYRDAGEKDKGELTPDEGKRLLRQIKQSGFRTVIFSGGEPLMRDDIFELIAYAKSQNLIPVLGSNGTLIDDVAARRLKRAGLKRAGISLDSADKKIHDEFRQTKGAWDDSIEAIGHLKNAGLEFQIHTTVTSYNYEAVLEVSDLAKRLEARAHHIFFLVPTGRGKDIEGSIPSLKQYAAVLRRILERQRREDIELKPVCAPQFIPLAREMNVNMRFQKGCLAGISYCCILPQGEVHPCAYLPLSLGNVRDESFYLIWRDNPVLNQLRAMGFKGRCGLCQFKDSCGGCRARAYYYSGGDYLAEDPWCILNEIQTYKKREKTAARASG